MSTYFGRCCATAVVMLTLGSFAAQAQQTQGSGIETVTVTARRHAEDVQKVPSHVDVLSQSDINKAGATITAYDLAQMVPGLQENATTDRANIDYAIRGQTHTY